MNDISSQPTWTQALLPPLASIKEAIACLEKTGLQIVLVVAQDGKLFGTLTDGDIRRALLRGMSMDQAIETVAHRYPLVVPEVLGREMVLQLMQANKVRQLPVVQSDGTVVGLHVWDEVLEPPALENTMIIMAGGLGTRLRPHTEHCPKCMLEVAGKPMLAHVIERARAEGFRHFVIAVHYLAEQIQDHFKDGSPYGVDLRYVREDRPLGTVGGLSLLPEWPTADVLVTNGDVLSDVHYRDILGFHQKHHAGATMAVRQYEISNPFGVVKISGIELAGFEEKPIYRSHINAGIYVLSPQALRLLDKGQHCDMPSLFQRVQSQGMRAIVYPMHEPWLDVGRPDDLHRANSTITNESRKK